MSSGVEASHDLAVMYVVAARLASRGDLGLGVQVERHFLSSPELGVQFLVQALQQNLFQFGDGIARISCPTHRF